MIGADIVYVALSGSRVPMVAAQLARLTEGGQRVTAVLADVPEWAQVKPPPTVTVRQVPAPPEQAVAGARRLLLTGDGPLTGATVLVAGDPQAVPIAWLARRRRPDLTVRFEPASDSDRLPATDLAVVTPWYPAPGDPLSGAAVHDLVAALGERYGQISVLHTAEWLVRPSVPGAPLLTVTVERMRRRVDAVVVEKRSEAEVTRVTAPIVAGPQEYRARVEAHLTAARAALPTGQIEAPVVHAHDGLFGGSIAVELARPEAQVVVFESSPLVPYMMADPGNRGRYERVLKRADEVVCASRYLRDAIVAKFPAYEAKVRVVPRLVDVDDLVPRADPPTALNRWLHIGPLVEARGVSVALEAFGDLAATDPAATLTVVDGVATAEKVRSRIRERGLQDRVRFQPAAPSSEPGCSLRDHDLLVHSGQAEQFGEILVEAVASGTPVLAARQPATEATLTALSEAAGPMVAVARDARGLRKGLYQLGRHLAELDSTSVRAELRARFGREVLLPQLLDEVAAAPGEEPDLENSSGAGSPAPTIPVHQRMDVPILTERVVLVAINAPRFTPVRDFALRAVAAGLGVDVITNDARLWREAASDPRLRIHAVDQAELRRPVLWVERALVHRVPGKLLSAARRRARRQEAIWPELGVMTAQRAHRKLAKLVHQKGFERGYQHVRPRVLWRVVRRDVLPKLDLSQTRRVVVAGVNGVTIGWQLARRDPELVVTTSLTGFEQQVT